MIYPPENVFKAQRGVHLKIGADVDGDASHIQKVWTLD